MSTTITGKIENLGQGNVTTGTFVRFYLRGAGGNLPRINGTAIIAPTLGNVYYFDFVPNASGVISGTLWSSRDSTGLLGGDIEAGGVTTAVWYGMVVYNNGKAGPETPVHAKNTATLDISNVTPITTNPVVTAPTGDSTYARLDGGNTPFTGVIGHSAGLTSTTGSFTGALTAQSMNDRLCVGAAPCYATVAAAATAAGSVNKTIIEIRSSYAGVDCGPNQSNIVYWDERGLNPPCNTTTNLSFNPATSAVPNMALEVFLNVSSPTPGQAITAGQYSTFVTGTLPGAGGLVDGFAATAFTTGLMSGTLPTLRGAEIAASVNGGGGAVTRAEGGASYVAGLASSTVTIGTAVGWTFAGCNGQTYGVAPTNCYGAEFSNQQSKASTRNYSAGFDSLALFLFDSLQTNGGFDCEDSSHVTHTCFRIDSGNNVNLNAIATNINLRDSGSTTRLQINGANVLLPTQGTVAQANQAGSPMALVAVTSQKTESAADTNVLTFTPPAVAGSYRIRFTMAVSAQNTATLGWTATWKDSNGSAQAPTNLSLFTSGTAAPALTVTAATNGNYYGEAQVDVDNSATNIVVKLTFTGTSFTAKVSATIERII